MTDDRIKNNDLFQAVNLLMICCVFSDIHAKPGSVYLLFICPVPFFLTPIIKIPSKLNLRNNSYAYLFLQEAP